MFKGTSNGEKPYEDIYPKNYEDSSKAMETVVVLHLYKILLNSSDKMYSSDKTLSLKTIVADDDSTMRALLQHESNNMEGILPLDMPQPE